MKKKKSSGFLKNKYKYKEMKSKSNGNMKKGFLNLNKGDVNSFFKK